MASASDERPAPSAIGSLATRPLVHLLVYARNHRLTGRLELHAPDGRGGTLSLWHGLLHDARTQPAVAYFGTVAYELGHIDTATLDATLLEISRSKRLHGEVLVERGALTPVVRDRILVEQTCRKIHFLVSLPPDASFAFFALEPGPNEPSFTLDPIRAAWIGLRVHPPSDGMRDALARFATQTLRVVNEGAIALAGLEPEEAALCRALVDRPMTVAQLRAATTLAPARFELLFYLLVITKCIEPVAATRSSGSSGTFAAMKVASPSSHRMRAAAATTLSPVELGATGIAHRARAILTEDPRTVLGLPPDASVEAARAAYFRLSKLWHPDRLPDDLAMFRSEVETIFDHLTRAHHALTDPEPRRSSARMAAASGPARTRSETIRAIEQALARREYETAEDASRQLTCADADDAEAHALAAWASTFAADAPDATLRAALHALDRAVQLDRHCARAHFYRGMIYKRLRNNVAAFRDLSRAVQLDPRNVDAQREVRIYEMRARKGSGEHALDALVVKAMKK